MDVRIPVLIMKADITVPVRTAIDSWTTTKDAKVHFHFVSESCKQ